MESFISKHEDARLAALHSLNILDTGPEHSFDRITRLARLALQMPIVLISLIDRDRQWFKSRQGIDATETPKSQSFCAYAIQQDEPFVVTDAVEHPLFCNNPLVLGEPRIRFYIGIPLKMRDGFTIGTLCAIDRRPRHLSADEVDILCDLARMAVDEIELRQIATTDALTDALTRRGFDIEINREFSRAKRSRHDLSLIAVDIDHFKAVNDRYGHAAGDIVLRSVVTLIKNELRSADFVARLGGEEFVIVLPETGMEGAIVLAERIRKLIAGHVTMTQTDPIHVTASFGISNRAAADDNWDVTLERADAALYEAKRSGRNKCVSRTSSEDGMAVALGIGQLTVPLNATSAPNCPLSEQRSSN